MEYLRCKYFDSIIKGIFEPKNKYIITFELQMAYVFLWTIIDRYKTLSYGMMIFLRDKKMITWLKIQYERKQ